MNWKKIIDTCPFSKENGIKTEPPWCYAKGNGEYEKCKGNGCMLAGTSLVCGMLLQFAVNEGEEVVN